MNAVNYFSISSFLFLFGLTSSAVAGLNLYIPYPEGNQIELAVFRGELRKVELLARTQLGQLKQLSLDQRVKLYRDLEKFVAQNELDSNLCQPILSRIYEHFFQPSLQLMTDSAVTDSDQARLQLAQMVQAIGSPNLTTETGHSAMHYAAVQGVVKNLRLLKSLGADINLVDRYGKTPLHYAVRQPNAAAVKWFIRNGAILDVYDADGLTPLQLALIHGRMAHARLLCDANPDQLLNTQDGRSLLHLAAQYGHYDLAQTFLSQSDIFDARESDHHGRTPRQLAKLGGHAQLVTLLDDHLRSLAATPRRSSVEKQVSSAANSSEEIGSYPPFRGEFPSRLRQAALENRLQPAAPAQPRPAGSFVRPNGGQVSHRATQVTK